MLAHTITMTVFCYPEDDRQALEQVFHRLLPLSFEDEKVLFISQKSVGIDQKIIMIRTLTLSKQRHIMLFLKNLAVLLNEEQKSLLLRQQESRTDADLNFFVRLDKEKLKEGAAWIIDEGNCFHIKICLAAFPKKQEKALGILKEIFK